MYRVDKEVDTDIQLKKRVLKPPATHSEEKGVTQSEPQLVQNMTVLPDTPIPKQSQETAQPQISSDISSFERTETQDKVITRSHAKFGQILKLKAMNRECIWDIIKEIPPYGDPLCIPSPRPLTYLC